MVLCFMGLFAMVLCFMGLFAMVTTDFFFGDSRCLPFLCSILRIFI